MMRLMRFMILVPASAESGSGALPDEKILAEMGAVVGEGLRTGWLIATGRVEPGDQFPGQ